MYIYVHTCDYFHMFIRVSLLVYIYIYIHIYIYIYIYVYFTFMHLSLDTYILQLLVAIITFSMIIIINTIIISLPDAQLREETFPLRRQMRRPEKNYRSPTTRGV